MEPIELTGDDIARVEALIDFEETGRRVAVALANLSPRLRDAVRLRVLDGRPYRQVAERLGCSEATARARVSRALRQLAEELGSEAS